MHDPFVAKSQQLGKIRPLMFTDYGSGEPVWIMPAHVIEFRRQQAHYTKPPRPPMPWCWTVIILTEDRWIEVREAAEDVAMMLAEAQP